MFQAVLHSQLLLEKELEGKVSSGFTGHWLQSRHRVRLELRGCAMPGREEAWPSSGSALVCYVTWTTLRTLCAVSAGAMCSWRLGGFIKFLLGKG